MKKIISVELIQRVADSLANMTGLSFIQVRQLINELSQLPEYKEKEKDVINLKDEEKKTV